MRAPHLFFAIAAGLFAPSAAIAKPGLAIRTQTGEAMRRIGFTTFGTADDRAALEASLASLSSLGVKLGHPKTPDGRIEQMIAFSDEIGPITATLIRQKLADGKLGHFEFENILVPETAIR